MVAEPNVTISVRSSLVGESISKKLLNSRCLEAYRGTGAIWPSAMLPSKGNKELFPADVKSIVSAMNRTEPSAHAEVRSAGVLATGRLEELVVHPAGVRMARIDQGSNIGGTG